MENKITGICQECRKQFDYVLKPGFPRKYCLECSQIKKAQYENKPLNQFDSQEDTPPMETQKIEGIRSQHIITQKNGQYTTMYVSYAKDIFCEFAKTQGKDLSAIDDMTLAIKLVKQAREAFE